MISLPAIKNRSVKPKQSTQQLQRINLPIVDVNMNKELNIQNKTKTEVEEIRNKSKFRDALARVIIKKEKIGSVQTDTGFDYKTIKRSVALNTVESLTGELDDMVLPAYGRKVKYTEQLVNELKTKLIKRDSEGNSVANIPIQRGDLRTSVPGAISKRSNCNSFASVVSETLKEEILKSKPTATVNELDAKVSVGALSNLRHRLNTEGITVKHGQNQRRHEALVDPYNFISLAAMLLIIYSHLSQIAVSEFANMTEQELQNDTRYQQNVDPRLIFNIDKSSSFLMDDEPTELILAEGSSGTLQQQHLNPTYVPGDNNTGQRRAVGYTAVTSAAGELLMHITHLRDHAYSGTTEKNRPCVLYKVSILTLYYI